VATSRVGVHPVEKAGLFLPNRPVECSLNRLVVKTFGAPSTLAGKHEFLRVVSLLTKAFQPELDAFL